MTLTKRLWNWTALLAEAEHQWVAGNSAGVRYFCRKRMPIMPADVRDKFFLLLCSDPVAKPANRPKIRKSESGTIIIDDFRIPDIDIKRYKDKLQRMWNEIGAHDLLEELRHARATGDKAFLRKHRLHNVTDGRVFKREARQYVEKKFHLLKSSERK